jgi:hypothetical protein
MKPEQRRQRNYIISLLSQRRDNLFCSFCVERRRDMILFKLKYINTAALKSKPHELRSVIAKSVMNGILRGGRRRRAAN